MRRKLKYQGGLTKKICQWVAANRRNDFSKKISFGKLEAVSGLKQIEFDVISFSGSKDFEEQVLSIYTFLKNAGSPRSWTVYSDGSYKKEQQDILTSSFSFLKIEEWNKYEFSLANEKREMLKLYIKQSPAAKKVTVLSCHPYERQTIYTDSDILFYPGAAKVFQHSSSLLKDFWFLADIGWDALDRNIFALEGKPLNLGFLILNKAFQFDPVFDYLESLSDNFHYFSDQTAFDLAFKAQGGMALKHDQFIVSVEDQFDFGYIESSKDKVLRHFVTPVRHKMWQQKLKNIYKR